MEHHFRPKFFLVAIHHLQVICEHPYQTYPVNIDESQIIIMKLNTIKLTKTLKYF